MPKFNHTPIVRGTRTSTGQEFRDGKWIKTEHREAEIVIEIDLARLLNIMGARLLSGRKVSPKSILLGGVITARAEGLKTKALPEVS